MDHGGAGLGGVSETRVNGHAAPAVTVIVPATVVRSTGDTILVRRQIQGATVTEAVPTGSVFAATRGGLAPATRITGAPRVDRLSARAESTPTQTHQSPRRTSVVALNDRAPRE